MSSGPLAGVTVIENASCISGPHSIARRSGDGCAPAVHAPLSSHPGRLAHVDEPVAELQAALGDHPREHWLTLLHEADVPAAPVHTVDEVVQDPHVVDAGLLRQAVGPAGERFLVPRGAIAYAGDLDACSMEVPALGG